MPCPPTSFLPDERRVAQSWGAAPWLALQPLSLCRTTWSWSLWYVNRLSSAFCVVVTFFCILCRALRCGRLEDRPCLVCAVHENDKLLLLAFWVIGRFCGGSITQMSTAAWRWKLCKDAQGRKGHGDSCSTWGGGRQRWGCHVHASRSFVPAPGRQR